MRRLMAVLLTLCLLCGALPAAASFVSSARNRFSIDAASYSVPADFSGISQDATAIMVQYADYEMVIMPFDYEAAGLAEQLTGDDLQAQNNNAGFFLMRSGYDAETVAQMLRQFIVIDAGLPCGGKILGYGTGYGVCLFHYCTGIGTQVLVRSMVLTLEEQLETGVHVLRSKLVERKTAEAAEEAPAERYVIITNASANVRMAPDPEAERLIIARQGESYLCLGMIGNWYMIDVDGQTGYVTNSLAALQE